LRGELLGSRGDQGRRRGTHKARWRLLWRGLLPLTLLPLLLALGASHEPSQLLQDRHQEWHLLLQHLHLQPVHRQGLLTGSGRL
jgi:hypothetical protein